MKRVFIDANVFLDAFLLRTNEYSFAKALLQQADERRLIAHTSPSLVLTTMYFLNKAGYSGALLAETIDNLLVSTSLLSPSEKIFRQGLYAGFADLEDGVQYHTALQGPNLDYFITANKKDFKKATTLLPVLSPKEFLALK